MLVTPMSSPDLEPSISLAPLIATEPPFLVVGTTSEPFQVQIELMFNPSTSGPGQNGQKVILEHWVGVRTLTLKIALQSYLVSSWT